MNKPGNQLCEKTSICMLHITCVGTEEARDRHQHDPERRPSRERRGGTRQRHTEDGRAVPDEHSHPRGMPLRTVSDHRLLQNREATHEHTDADTAGGAHAVRNPAAMLEKRVGRDVEPKKVLTFGARSVAASRHRPERKALAKGGTVN